MLNRIFFFIIGLGLCLWGIALISGGYYSAKHRFFISYGEYNTTIGLVVIVISILFFYIALIKGGSDKRD